MIVLIALGIFIVLAWLIFGIVAVVTVIKAIVSGYKGESPKPRFGWGFAYRYVRHHNSFLNHHHHRRW